MEKKFTNQKYCELCNEKARSLCFKCNMNFCDTCFKFIHEKKNNLNHKKETIDLLFQ